MKLKSVILLLLFFFSPLLSAEKLTDLSTAELVKLQRQQKALIIDIRTEKEWAQTGVIPDSHKLQFFSVDGKYNAEKWLSAVEQLKTSADQPLILVCRSGNRSGMVGNMLSNQLGMKNIYHLSSGIQSWIKHGNPVIQK